MIVRSLFALLLISICGCPAAAGTSPAPAASPAPAPGKIELRLRANALTVAVGGEIRLSLEIANGTARAVTFDDGSLTAYQIVRNAKGAEIPQWPFFDIMYAAPGKEALWTLGPGKIETRSLVLAFRNHTWSGFGIPGSTYRGFAIEAGYEAGAAIHAVEALPATVSILTRWIADPETVRSRAAKLGVPPAWSGELSSNAVEIRLVENR